MPNTFSTAESSGKVVKGLISGLSSVSNCVHCAVFATPWANHVTSECHPFASTIERCRRPRCSLLPQLLFESANACLHESDWRGSNSGPSFTVDAREIRMAFGKRTSMSYNASKSQDRCVRCTGTGRIKQDGSSIVCRSCAGTGKTTTARRLLTQFLRDPPWRRINAGP